MTLASTSRASLVYAPESTYGTVPVAGNHKAASRLPPCGSMAARDPDQDRIPCGQGALWRRWSRSRCAGARGAGCRALRGDREIALVSVGRKFVRHKRAGRATRNLKRACAWRRAFEPMQSSQTRMLSSYRTTRHFCPWPSLARRARRADFGAAAR
jgi:hypothetical protein